MVAPTLTSVSIESNNSNPVLAGIFDDVILTFTADQEITTPTVSIDGQDADSVTNITGDKWTAQKKMKSDDSTGSVPFTIDYANTSAESGTQVLSTTDGSIVTFNEDNTTIPKFADTDRVYKDIGKTRGSNENRDNLVTRSDEDASSKLQAIFLNLIDTSNLDSIPWFTDLATELTTAMFWKKSNGTQDQMQAVKDIIAKAEEIRTERFVPQEYR